MPDWIVWLVVAGINILGVIFTAMAANIRSNKSEYINMVSASRREWLEKVRNNFIQYNRIIQEQRTDTSEFALNHIEMNLLLNPTEKYTSLLSMLYSALKIKEDMSEEVTSEEVEAIINESIFVSAEEFERLKKLLLNKELDEQELYNLTQLIQEIILKREWEIIKQEVKYGGKIKDGTEEEKTAKAVRAVDSDKKIAKVLMNINA